MKPRLLGRIAISLVALGILGARHWNPSLLPPDATTLGLLTVAVLPWLYTVLDSAEFPGGWKLQFRKLQAAVDQQEKVIADQQRAINDLVKYSISASIFHHLCGVALLREYRYRDGEANRREMYFLRDNGLLRPKGSAFLDFNEAVNGKNLVEVAAPTEIGWNCIKLRRQEIPSDMLADRSNLVVDPATL